MRLPVPSIMSSGRGAGCLQRMKRMVALALAMFVFVSRNCFSMHRQEPLRQLRERDGMEIPGLNIQPYDALTKEGRQLLSKITAAGDRGDWRKVQSIFSRYAGTETPIYNAVMHIAYRCGQYREAGLVYERLCSLNVTKTSPTFTAALSFYSKMNDQLAMQRVWSEARQTLELDVPMAGARIAAAGRAGDVETAAVVLDEMNQSRLEIQTTHVSSAIRACWGASGQHHNAAKYLFNLMLNLDLQPNIVTFTNLAGAYSTATLQEVLSVYARMQEYGIQANKVFAEVYLTAVLSITKKETKWAISELILHLSECSQDRATAAKAALADFKAAGIDLTAFCTDMDRALQQLENQENG